MTARARRQLLDNLPPRGILLEEAAAYVGSTVAAFLEERNTGLWPPPRRTRFRDGWRAVYDLHAA